MNIMSTLEVSLVSSKSKRPMEGSLPCNSCGAESRASRADEILDAAAMNVTLSGKGEIDIRCLASVSGYPIKEVLQEYREGSDVIRALADRHTRRMQEITREIGMVTTDTWSQLSAQRLMILLITPYTEYLQRNPDYIVLLNHESSSESVVYFIDVIRRVLEIRLPGLNADQRESYALMMHAMTAGSLSFARYTEKGMLNFYLGEMPRVLACYLSDIERAADFINSDHP
jgi:hypothetical protein